MTEASLQAFDRQLNLWRPTRATIVACALLCVTLGVLIASTMIGSYPLSVNQVWATMLGSPPTEMAGTVVWEFRLPRAIAALIVGGFLALSGATLQYVTRNPLADPSLVGVSQGAALAVVAVTILMPDFGIYWRPVLAFGGALAVAGFIQVISASRRGGETLRFILTGIGVAALIASITSALLTYGDIDRAMSALGWLAGSMHATGWDEVSWLCVTTIVIVPILFLAARPLSALRFGPEVATGLGIRVRLSKACLITLSVALAATAVAAVGPLGFVGLVAPHLARRLARSGVGMHLVMTGLTGALMTGLADLIGRAAFAPLQIPAGLVTAIIGVPVFVILILRTQSRSQL